MPSLNDITAQYPILMCLAEWLSTLDLFHLALTSRRHYDLILASKSVFSHLKRTALCDGRGLARRQNVPPPPQTGFGGKPLITWDEPIEVQLWATRCDEAGALPCRKCGINVCEVRRFL